MTKEHRTFRIVRLLVLLAALGLHGEDAEALSPGPEVRCCAGEQEYCGGAPPSAEACEGILAAFDEASRRWHEEAGMPMRSPSLLQRLFDTLQREPGVVILVLGGLALIEIRKAGLEDDSLQSRAVFVAGGSCVAFGLLWLLMAFR